MWYKRDFQIYMAQMQPEMAHPIKVLKGPRQVGKTSLLERLHKHKVISLDDFQTRQRAMENPRLFLEQYQDQPILLDEASLAPPLFPELKRLIDDFRRRQKKNENPIRPDIWLTGSNQTLLENSVQESLAGRASYFDLNTLSQHELGERELSELMLKGGWPELYTNPSFPPSRYLNDLISTFIERDIVAAAGIERKAAFITTTALLAGRIGQLINASDIGKNVGAETTTVQSWIAKLQQNALVRVLLPYYNNLNQRWIKTPKIYFEDVGLAVRLQGWNDFQPLFVSPAFGHLVENLAVIEFSRFFSNQALPVELFFLRNKEKVEIDLLVKLTNNRWLAVEVKSNPTDMTSKQIELLAQTKLNIIDRWVVCPGAGDEVQLENCRIVRFIHIFTELSKIF